MDTRGWIFCGDDCSQGNKMKIVKVAKSYYDGWDITVVFGENKYTYCGCKLIDLDSLEQWGQYGRRNDVSLDLKMVADSVEVFSKKEKLKKQIAKIQKELGELKYLLEKENNE